jgi:hypothetical protein
MHDQIEVSAGALLAVAALLDAHASELRQTDEALLIRARAQTTLARMSVARAVQMNGLGSRL